LVLRARAPGGEKLWTADFHLSEAQCGGNQTPVVQGFGDLTGDGVDDVALTRKRCNGSALELAVLDGRSGKVARTQLLDEPVEQVQLLPSLDESGSVTVLGSSGFHPNVAPTWHAWGGASGRLLWTIRPPSRFNKAELNLASRQPHDTQLFPNPVLISAPAADKTGDKIPDLLLTAEQTANRTGAAMVGIVDGRSGTVIAQLVQPQLRAEPIDVDTDDGRWSGGVLVHWHPCATCNSPTVAVFNARGKNVWLNRSNPDQPRVVFVAGDIDGDGTADVALGRPATSTRPESGTIVSGRSGRILFRGLVPKRFSGRGLQAVSLSLDEHGDDFIELTRRPGEVGIRGIEGTTGHELWTALQSYPKLEDAPEIAEPLASPCPLLALLARSGDSLGADIVTVLDRRSGRLVWTLGSRSARPDIRGEPAC
jgi:hypothetical protein